MPVLLWQSRTSTVSQMCPQHGFTRGKKGEMSVFVGKNLQSLRHAPHMASQGCVGGVGKKKNLQSLVHAPHMGSGEKEPRVPCGVLCGAGWQHLWAQSGQGL